MQNLMKLSLCKEKDTTVKTLLNNSKKPTSLFSSKVFAAP